MGRDLEFFYSFAAHVICVVLRLTEKRRSINQADETAGNILGLTLKYHDNRDLVRTLIPRNTRTPRPDENMNSRYEPLLILNRHGISACLWGEDALAFYAVPTVLFETYVLVPDEDLDRATEILRSSQGYDQPPPDEKEMRTVRFRQVFLKYWSHRFMGSWSQMTGLQLLPAQEFAYFTINKHTTIAKGPRLYPKLEDFIESLVKKFVEATDVRSELAYCLHNRLYLAYLCGSAPERHSVLNNLSPKARRVWKDLLDEQLILGEEGRRIYRED